MWSQWEPNGDGHKGPEQEFTADVWAIRLSATPCLFRAGDCVQVAELYQPEYMCVCEMVKLCVDGADKHIRADYYCHYTSTV